MIRGRKTLGTLLGSTLIAALICGPLTAGANAATDPSTQHGDGLLVSGQTLEPRIALGSSIYGNPDSVDLRAWAVPAGDQGSLNSCVSWALGYTMLGWYSKKMGTPTTFAPMYIYSQTHLTNASDGGGSYVRDAANVASSQGVDTFQDYQPQGNYNFTDQPTAAQQANAAPYKTLGVQRLYANAAGNVGGGAQNVIEQSLAAGYPVGLAIPIYEQFYYVDNNNYNFTNAQATGSIYGYHYTAALGYDSTGVWIENSWGTWWGQNGFAHLDWDFVNSKSVEAEKVYGFAAPSLPSQQTATPTPTATADPTPTTPVVTPTADPTPTTPVVTPTADPTPTTQPTQNVPTTQPTQNTPTTQPTQNTPTTQPIQNVPTTQPIQNVPSTQPTAPAPNDTADVPTTPGKANVIDSGTQSLSVRWNAPADNGGATITGYKVTISTGSWSRVLATTNTNALFANLTPNTLYTVNVRAVNAAGYSDPSVSVIQTDAAAPTIAGVSAKVSKNALSASWKASSVGKDKVSKTTITVKQGKKTLSKKTYKASVRKASVKLGSIKKTYNVDITVYAVGGKHATKSLTIKNGKVTTSRLTATSAGSMRVLEVLNVGTVKAKTAKHVASLSWKATGLDKNRVQKSVIRIKLGNKTVLTKTVKGTGQSLKAKINKSNHKKTYTVEITVYATGSRQVNTTGTIRV